ncbi:MAG: multicopper oxidase domain-containing protein [Thermomicrobiales bacterium]
MVHMTRRAFVLSGASALTGLLAVARLAPLAQRSNTTEPPATAAAAPVASASPTAAVTPAASAAAHVHVAEAAPPGTPTATATATAASPTTGTSAATSPAATPTAAATVPNTGTLPIPPLLSPAPRDGVRTFELTLQRGQVAFEAGRPLATFGINGPYLGPTLRATRGDEVAFVVANQLGAPTTLHWHGMHLPAAMDGGPHQAIASGATWQPRYTIRQEAATLWYHPHPMGSTRAQVTGGAVGMFILDDDNPAQVALPHTYGVDDIPLILQDYATVGSGLGDAQANENVQTGPMLVNGALVPTLATAQARLRLRLLNGSAQRLLILGFAGDLPFAQVASDGGLLPAPARLTRLVLGSAERAEIVVDLADAPSDAPLALQTFGSAGNAGGGGGRGGGGGNGGAAGQGATLLTIQGPGLAAARAANLPPLPAQLNSIARLDPAAAAVTRTITLGGGGRGNTTINGQQLTSMAQMMDLTNAPRVRLGDVERWNIVNASNETHMLHIHDIQFQIVARGGTALEPGDLGGKDTVMVRPGETAALLMRFEDYADPETPYMFHCHILQHEDEGMMAQFLVVPG